MCTNLMCHIIVLKVVLLTSSSIFLASLMCTDLMCHMIGLTVVELTFSSRYLATGMCTVLFVSNNWTLGSSTDI